MTDMNLFNPRISIIDKVLREIKGNRYLLSYLLIVAIIAFANELFNFSLTIDEELNTGISAENSAYRNTIWVLQGRWGMYILTFLFPVNTTIPFAPLFITLIFSALSFAIVTKVFSVKRGGADFISAPLFLACPVLYYTYQFNTLNYGVGIGFFVGAVAIYYFTQRKGLLSWVIPSILMAFCIGIYQSFLPWLVILICFHILAQVFRSDKLTLKRYWYIVIQFVGLIILSLAFYVVISKCFYFMLDTHQNSYLDAYSRWELSWRYLSQVISSIKEGMFDYYTNRTTIYYSPIKILPVLFLSSFSLVLIAVLKSNKPLLVKLMGIITLVVIIVLPFSMNLILGSAMPARTMLAVPLVLSGLLFFAFSTCSVQMIKLLLVLMTLICSFQFISINSRFSFSDQMMWKADREFTSRFYTEMEKQQVNLPVKLLQQTWPFMLVGTHSWPEHTTMIKRETIGASFYEWGSGYLGRATSLMKTMGIHDYKKASITEQVSIIRAAHEMPVWPMKGSVAVISDVMVVKIGNYTAPQLQQACTGISTDEVCRIQYHPSDDGVRIFTYKDISANDNLIFDFIKDINDVGFHEAKKQIINNKSVVIESLSPQSTLILPPIRVSNKKVRLNMKLHANAPLLMKMFLFKDKDNIGSELHIKLTEGNNDFSLLIPSYLANTMIRISPFSAASQNLTIEELVVVAIH